MRKLALAGMLAAAVTLAAPATAKIPSQIKKGDPSGDVAVRHQQGGNQDIDIQTVLYQYYASTYKPAIWFEYRVRKVKPERKSLQLYMTQFAIGKKRYRLVSNDQGTAALYMHYGGSWIEKTSCTVNAAVNPGSTIMGGNVVQTVAGGCFRAKAKVKILFSQTTNHPAANAADVAAMDRVKVNRKVKDS